MIHFFTNILKNIYLLSKVSCSHRLEPAGAGWNRLEPAGTGWSWILIGAHFSSLGAVSSEPLISCMELDTSREGRSSFQQNF
jgi:hypothetical protein